MGWRGRLKLPKEHGAWAMLYVPLAIGTLAAEGERRPVLWLGLAVTFLFIARESVLAWWRARRRGQRAESARTLTLIYLGLALVFGAPLLLEYRLFGLIPLAIGAMGLLFVNAEQAVRLEDRTILGELLAILGLTMTAPAAHYAIRREWEPMAVGLWGVSALYFASSVFYVKLRVQAAYGRSPERRERARRQCAIYHAFLIIALLGLAFTHRMGVFLAIAFAPALGRALRHVVRPAERVDLRRVGLAEIANALVFLIFAALAFRSL
ncbi:MAG: YwiC-like family protein [Blastocatellia bacterium]|nr:YwiC-like family protein [Blastocatellia bacterium]MCS7158494.1 YwiC-like family protein [Blastocatellia bacterium]MCX7753435.1 YwiC-like family protein [Blastocatellia bacterium]MDW8167825.1 YwiC-like family protein [Acidobacteriota bacterium]MDW8257358.1 YwiC-like family protein [Acidobacteriota bacterium]